MRKLFISILILLTVTSCLYSQSFEVVDSPAYYYILVDNDTIDTRFTKESKAILKAAEMSLTSDNVVLLRPRATFTFDGSIGVDLSDVYARLDSLEFANELQGMAINDLYNNVIPELQQQIAYLDTLNRRKHDVLKNRIDNYHAATTQPPQPNGNLLGNVIAKGDGWIDNGNGSYYYNDTLNYQYLVFDLTEDLNIGDTYNITYDIETQGTAQLSIWLYEVETSVYPTEWESGKVSGELLHNTGEQSFEVTIGILDRNRLAFRAILANDDFTISNIEIKKQ